MGLGGGVATARPSRRRVSVAARDDRPRAVVGLRRAGAKRPGNRLRRAGAKRPGNRLRRARRGRQHVARAGTVRRATGGGGRSAPGRRRDGGPRALQEARRGMALAAGLRLPLVLVIDTAGPRCPRRPSRAGWPVRSPAVWPNWSRWTRRRCRCCSARAAAGLRWRWCPPTGYSPRCTAGWLPCRRRGRARSSSATPTTPRNWLRRKAFGRPT